MLGPVVSAALSQRADGSVLEYCRGQWIKSIGELAAGTFAGDDRCGHVNSAMSRRLCQTALLGGSI